MIRYGKKNRKFSVMLTAILFLLATISIGFAAFSNTLTISSSVIVTPDEDSFKIELSSSQTEVVTEPIIGTGSDSVIKADAIIENGTTPTLSNINLTFTKVGANATYIAYVHNTGQYDAYLTDIIFNNVSGTDFPRKCTAIEGTNQESVDKICDTFSMKITATGKDLDGNEKTDETLETLEGITGHIIKKGETEILKIVISYETNAEGLLADGDFTVAFGDINLIYKTTDS